jgi:putative membrane-bound dehydrogenase-like protein
MIGRLRQLALAFSLLAAGGGFRALAGPPSTAEAIQRFRVAEGFEVRLVAAEPLVRQPVTMTFDDRGRMWVIQYLQYPNPAGLRPVEVDRYLRTKYDRVPEPPPRGPRGADRVTILEDTDGDGQADRAKDFVTGLNLASGLALGHGGVFVAQAPYLLFYPDRNRDDVPDGDPQVLLQGFGLEDAHAVVNSLTWGPDGWLYGAQGSTVTADIRGIGFQQGIWRYHPGTGDFELFAEGGGNTWGLDFDRHGNVLAGTNYGERILLHQVQGAYYVKGFAKHGPLHNPFALGYFDHAPHQGHAGGHVTCGGVVYRAPLFGPSFQNAYVAANLLSSAVYWHAVEPDRSTFRTRYQGTLLATDDPWFRPVDCLAGPDGAVYVADWCDPRSNHVIPEDTWHKDSGRIWRVAPRGAAAAPPLNLAGLPSGALVDLLNDQNAWYVGQARRLLSERRDPAVVPRLLPLVAPAADSPLALEALWALAGSGGWNATLARQLLLHPQPSVRAWTVRLLGDGRRLDGPTRAAVLELARREVEPTVRCQLAATAKRLEGDSALPLLAELLGHDADQHDPFIPLLLWWAIEDKAVSHRGPVLDLVRSADAWNRPLIAPQMVERLVQRYVGERSEAGYAAVAALFAAAPTAAHEDRLVAAMDGQLAGRPLPAVPAALVDPLAKVWSRRGKEVPVIRWAARLGSSAARQRALASVADRARPEGERLPLLEVAGQGSLAETLPLVLRLLDPAESDAVRRAALGQLERFEEASIAAAVLDRYAGFSGELQARAVAVLSSRPAWAGRLLDAVDVGQIDAAALSLDNLRRIVQHAQPPLTARVERRWGRVRAATPGELQAQIVVLARTLSQGPGQLEPGQKLFLKHCGTCHTLFGEGQKVGPDLTSADRRNQDSLLLNIVDPNSTVRPEYVAQVVTLQDGRVLTGLLGDSGPQRITLLDGKNPPLALDRDQVESLVPSQLSLMPEKLLEPLQPQELRDLFRYLQSDGPRPAAPPASP